MSALLRRLENVRVEQSVNKMLVFNDEVNRFQRKYEPMLMDGKVTRKVFDMMLKDINSGDSLEVVEARYTS